MVFIFCDINIYVMSYVKWDPDLSVKLISVSCVPPTPRLKVVLCSIINAILF